MQVRTAAVHAYADEPFGVSAELQQNRSCICIYLPDIFKRSAHRTIIDLFGLPGYCEYPIRYVSSYSLTSLADLYMCAIDALLGQGRLVYMAAVA